MKFGKRVRRRMHLFLEDHHGIARVIRLVHIPVFLFWKLRVRLRAAMSGHAGVDPHKKLWVNPKDIEFALRMKGKPFRKYADRGSVVAGDWDKQIHPFEEKDVYKAFVKHFVYGCSWEETGYYQRLAREVQEHTLKRGMRSMEDLRRRLAYLDRLFVNMKRDGYISVADLPEDRDDPSAGAEDEISVCIGRAGELLFDDGRHRLSMARILGVERVPVKVTVRHRKWMEFVSEVQAYAQAHSGKLYNAIPHPDLCDIPAMHGMERFDIVRGHLPAPPGRVLDIGCNWGFFCIELERLGFECTGVEANERYIYFQEKIRKACGCDYKLVCGSIFEYFSEETFDLVLALYIFHHFLKTEALHDQLVNLLARLKMKRMIFGCHNEDQEGMQNGYRNYNPEEFVDFIIRNSCMNKASHIGTEAGRRELFLLEA